MSLVLVSVMARRFAQHDLYVYLLNIYCFYVYRANVYLTHGYCVYIYCPNTYNIVTHGSVHRHSPGVVTARLRQAHETSETKEESFTGWTRSSNDDRTDRYRCVKLRH